MRGWIPLVVLAPLSGIGCTGAQMSVLLDAVLATETDGVTLQLEGSGGFDGAGETAVVSFDAEGYAFELTVKGRDLIDLYDVDRTVAIFTGGPMGGILQAGPLRTPDGEDRAWKTSEGSFYFADPSSAGGSIFLDWEGASLAAEAEIEPVLADPEAAGPGGGDPGGTIHCAASSGVCTQTTATGALATAYESDCAADGATFASGPCPTGVASCTGATGTTSGGAIPVAIQWSSGFCAANPNVNLKGTCENQVGGTYSGSATACR